MSKLVIEYLICIDNEIPLLVDEQSIKDFLRLNKRDEVTVEANNIKFENIVVDYNISLSRSNKERIFILKIIYNQGDVENHFKACLKLREKIRGTLEYLPKLKICTIWDDLSSKQSKDAYSLIQEVENLMRKLITEFMVINVGAEWAINAVSEEIKKNIKGGKKVGDELDVLYHLDFIKLTDVLLTPYRQEKSKNDDDEVYQSIFRAETSSELDINELKRIVSLSNWQRYFSALIQYDSKKIKDNWEKLYQLRNKIAHNNFLEGHDYQDIVKLTNELKEKLEDAIDKLDTIVIPEEEKESIRESSRVIINIDAAMSRQFALDELKETLIDSGLLVEGGIVSIFNNINEQIKEQIRETAKSSGFLRSIENARTRVNVDRTVSELTAESEDIEDKSLHEESEQ